MIGQTISHYKILEKLGGGGMGVVYKAEDTRLKRTVALKFLPPELTRDPEAKERFIHEAQAASALQHNNICVVYDIDETSEGELFICMEHLDGETLKKKIERGPLKIEEAIDMAIQVAQGLEEAHKHQIVHRDIKPANVLVTTSGVAKIVDFGLAKLAGRTVLTKSGSTVGTVAYMSPEQAKGEAVDARTDIWSLGVLIYEMVTGQRPFKGEYDNAVMYSILNVRPEAMTGLRTGIRVEIERIVNKALAKDSSERYQHVDELLVDLRRVKKESETSEILGLKAPGVAAPEKWLRVAAASAVGLLALILIMIFDPFGLRTSLKEIENTSSKTLAVMYFENIRDPEDKDHYGEALTRLMITSLCQTQGLEVISRERLYEIQSELGQSGPKKIEPSLASKIAQRAGATIMLTGSILETQPQLVVMAQLVEVKSGKILAPQKVHPYQPDQIFELVDSLSFLVKKDLSVTAGSPNELRSVTSITTKSPEAYRAYVEGDELRKRLQGLDAKTALERAIELDSKLVMAYYALQEVDNLIGDRAGAREAIVKAWDLRGNVTEMERLLIEAGYYADVEGNTMKTAQILEVLVQKFPHYQAAYRPLVSAHLDRCEFEEAEKAISKGLMNDSLDRRLLNQSAYLSAGFNQKQRALNTLDQFLRIAPVEANVYDSKGELHYWFGDADSAVYWFKRANAFRANFSSRGLARIALLRQDYRAAADYFSSLAAGGPDDKAESECASTVISMHQGKLRMAQNELVRNLQSHRAKQLTRAVSLDCTYLTFLSYELRENPAMVSYAQMRADERKKTRSDLVYGRDLLAWAWLMSGNATKSSVLLDEINHDIKGTSRRWQLVLAYATALLSYEKGDYQNCLNQFDRAFQLLFPNRPPDFFYGVVLVKTGNTAKGIHELQRVAIWFPFLWNVLSIYPTTLYWPIASVKAHYWLGVAYEFQGQNEQALKEFQQFLDIWKDADFDSPELKDAKVSLQRLKGLAGK